MNASRPMVAIMHKLVKKTRFSPQRLFSACAKLYSPDHTQSDITAAKLSEVYSPSPWKICAAVCLTRLPLLEPEQTEFEKQYSELLEKVELEQSVISDWEAEKVRQDFIRKEIEDGKQPPRIMDFNETLQDIEDQNEALLEEFRNTSKQNTSHPNNSDLRSIVRRPADTLVLVTKQVLGKDDVWMLPVTGWRTGETMRESAERALSSHCGEQTNATFLSNAPSGYYKFKFPKGARQDSNVGAKLFIYSAFMPRLVDYTQAAPLCTIIPNKKVLDYAWLAEDELRAFLKPKYFTAVQKIML